MNITKEQLLQAFGVWETIYGTPTYVDPKKPGPWIEAWLQVLNRSVEAEYLAQHWERIRWAVAAKSRFFPTPADVIEEVRNPSQPDPNDRSRW